MENCLPALFYILIYIYLTSHRKLAFAQRIFVQVENCKVKLDRGKILKQKTI